MLIVKGFYEYPSLYNNQEHVIAQLGELSTNSRTYALDKTVYSLPEYKNVTFVSFYNIKDDNAAVLDSTYRNLVLNIGDYIFERAQDRTIGSNVNNFRMLLLDEFNGTIDSLTSGKMTFNGTLWMPEWIQFKVTNSADDNLFRIWLSDQAFAQQYDEYLIEIIHPIIPYDDFFKDPRWVREQLKNYDVVGKMNEVGIVRREYPYTHLNAYAFEYTPPGMPEFNTKAVWLAVIYGEAGNSNDLVKDKIMEDILSESEHSRDEWEEIIPELSTNPEIIFVPNFNRYSVETSDHRAGIYSPIVDPREMLELVKATVRGNRYTSTYIENNWELSANIYKSLAFASIGTSETNGTMLKFSTRIKDYIIASNTSTDINRLSTDTIEWMEKFTGLIKAAETMNQYSSVPLGYTRIMRGDIIYAAFHHNFVNYLMVSKHNIELLDL